MTENDDLDWATVLQELKGIAQNVTSRFPAWIRSETDDIVNDAAIKLWRLGIERPSKKLSYIMLRQAAIDRWRARRRLRPLSGAEVVDQRGLESADVERRADLWKQLQLSLGTISEEERQLLTRFYLERVDIKQLAEEAGVKYSAMAVRLHRIKRRLRDHVFRSDV
jgi:RNA polymerase sigma factor (sigma-70 family)